MKKIIKTGHFGMRLPVQSPFILTAHHYDLYPQGNEKMEPVRYLEKWERGQDFAESQPWRMYHGSNIPGFPAHPHRGFETVTIVEKGFVDHTDGSGAAGRYGEGDVQWMTAGSGMQHCEMFPLVHQDKENTLDLFQIWLNLPAQNKLVEPHYKMLWHEDIPVVHEVDASQKSTKIKIVAGDYKNVVAPKPAPDSWAADKSNQVAIWLLDMEPEATFTLRETTATATRMLYFYAGEELYVEGEKLQKNNYAELLPDQSITIKNGSKQGKILLLEGEPINEPVAAYGPFVMNTQDEIVKAYEDFQKTEFGGWPHATSAPVNPPAAGRFAKYNDGTTEYPPHKQ